MERSSAEASDELHRSPTRCQGYDFDRLQRFPCFGGMVRFPWFSPLVTVFHTKRLCRYAERGMHNSKYASKMPRLTDIFRNSLPPGLFVAWGSRKVRLLGGVKLRFYQDFEISHNTQWENFVDTLASGRARP